MATSPQWQWGGEGLSPPAPLGSAVPIATCTKVQVYVK